MKIHPSVLNDKKKKEAKLLKGIVLSNKSNLYKVETENKIYDCYARGKIKNNDLSPVAGDIVTIEVQDEEENAAVIEGILERKNYIKRPKMANLSQIILVVSMKMPKPDLLLLDKQIVYAELMKIKPVICLNKIDLEIEEKTNRIYNLYKSIGYDVIKTNAKEQIGVKEITNILRGNITAFSGNSGVGKSTLLNCLLGENITEEGNISNKNKRGKNTTTQVMLYKVEENSYIADTPGFSTLDVNELEKDELAQYFIEFKKYLEDCEYVDCSHIREKNCGVKEALEAGKISQERYDRYCQIYEELKNKKKVY